ncbi:hypothetical protein HDU86_000831 [Geranomyces michiganensis]|nr:hypothetical protein HDU86_000831 [Geranomyces michiganensis]
MGLNMRKFTQVLPTYGSPELVKEWARRTKLNQREKKQENQREQQVAVLPQNRQKQVLTVQRRPKDDLGPQEVIVLTKYMDFEIKDLDTGETVLFASRTVTANKLSFIRRQALKMIVSKLHPVGPSKSYSSSGLMVGIGVQDGNATTPYVLKEKYRNPETVKLLARGASEAANAILDDARVYHAEVVKKMEQVVDEKFLGKYPMFVTEDYEAGLHVADDESEYAIGYATEEASASSSDGVWLFDYPEYGVSIAMEHNTLWSWKMTCLHGTTLGKMRRGKRYTGVLVNSHRFSVLDETSSM